MLESLNVCKDTKHESEHGYEHSFLSQVLIIFKEVDQNGLCQVNQTKREVLHKVCEAELYSLTFCLFNLLLACTINASVELVNQDLFICNACYCFEVRYRVSQYDISFLVAFSLVLNQSPHFLLDSCSDFVAKDH